ncbi:uncharacterized protein [Asterias amurensis]|uniref:uncharacterized protein isoform X2 n=1 Tax=Asterias amurensis TaxID=7602 RepID=UPI003AB43CA8
MKGRCIFVVNCAVLLCLFIASVSSAEESDDAVVQSEETALPFEVNMPEFAEGVTVKRLATLGECKRIAVKGNWLEVEFFAQQMKDDGTILERFDSTKSRKRSLMIEVGGDHKLPGLYEGLKDVCVGEQREITIQPGPMLEVDTKYGLKQPKTDREAVYTITIRSIQDMEPTNIFNMMDADKDDQLTKDEVRGFFINQGYAEEDKADDMLDKMFEAQDMDTDDVITFDEFRGPKHFHDEF